MTRPTRLQRFKDPALRRQRLPISAFKERETQKRFGFIVAGKLGWLAAMAVIALGFHFLGGDAGASTARRWPSRPAADLINPINTVWVLVAAFLVFFMQAGFMALEAGLRPVPGVRQHHDGVHLRHLPVRAPVLGDRLRLPVRHRQRPHRALSTSSCTARPTYDYGGSTRASRSSPSSCSSSPSPTPPRRSPRAPWSVAPASRATSSTASRCPASSTRSSATGSGVRAAGSATPWAGSTASSPDGIVFRDFAGSTVVHTVGGFIALAGAIALGPRLGRKFKRDGGGPTAAARPQHRRHRRRHPVVRLVRLQPRLDPVGHGLRGHRPGRRQHHAGRLRRRPGRGALRLPPLEEVGRGHGDQRLPRRPRRHHRSLLLGVTRPGRSSSAPSPASSCRSASTCSSTSASTTRSAPSPVHGFCGIWGTLSLGLFATGEFGIPGTGRRRQQRRRSRASSTAAAPASCWPRSSAALTCVVVVGGVGLRPDVRHPVDPGHLEPAPRRRTASSRASTSSSTACPPTTWSSARASATRPLPGSPRPTAAPTTRPVPCRGRARRRRRPVRQPPGRRASRPSAAAITSPIARSGPTRRRPWPIWSPRSSSRSSSRR